MGRSTAKKATAAQKSHSLSGTDVSVLTALLWEEVISPSALKTYSEVYEIPYARVRWLAAEAEITLRHGQHFSPKEPRGWSMEVKGLIKQAGSLKAALPQIRSLRSEHIERLRAEQRHADRFWGLDRIPMWKWFLYIVMGVTALWVLVLLLRWGDSEGQDPCRALGGDQSWDGSRCNF